MIEHVLSDSAWAGKRVAAVALALGLAAIGCEKTPEPSPAPAPPAKTAATATTAATAATTQAAAPAHQELAWDAPAGWEKVANPSAMRKATYRIPKAKGDADDAELSVSQAGGSVEMNVKRWTGQFEKATEANTKRTEKRVGDLKVTIVEVEGTFSGSGMPGAPPAPPKSDYALLGAIVETGTSPYFFKMTGPKATVTAAKADFEKLIDSLRAR